MLSKISFFFANFGLQKQLRKLSQTNLEPETTGISSTEFIRYRYKSVVVNQTCPYLQDNMLVPDSSTKKGMVVFPVHSGSLLNFFSNLLSEN